MGLISLTSVTKQDVFSKKKEEGNSMLIPLLSYMQDRLPFGNSLKGISPAMLKDFMRMTKAPHWHEYAIRQRQWRRHACTACRWLCGVLPRDAAIFEPGCGSAANLLWLGQKGFRRLSGSDISPEALDLGMQLAGSLHLPLDVWHDDALHPMRLPQQLDGILSVNWLYHIPGADFADFLQRYRPALKRGGYLACDMVTRHYDRVPGNQWHSDDGNLPEMRRRPSEYTLRLDPGEVRDMADQNGYRLVRHTCFVLSRPQRAVYLLRREA